MTYKHSHPDNFYKVFIFNAKTLDESKSVFQEIVNDIGAVYSFYSKRANEQLYIPIISLAISETEHNATISYNELITIDFRAVINENKLAHTAIYITDHGKSIAPAFSGLVKAIIYTRFYPYNEYTYEEFYKKFLIPVQERMF